jgi:spore coat polysaccharide biosynthesis protein SpsF
MRILAIIQARMSSSRLPGKVLMPILNEPMLFRQIERVNLAKLIDKVIVATSNEASDNPISEFCTEKDISCFKGSLNDVLDRYYQAAKLYNPEHVVRLTADCPLLSPQIIDEVISLHLDTNADYTSNCITYTLPQGLDTEVFKVRALQVAARNATNSEDREHVTPYIKRHDDLFHIEKYLHKKNLSGRRWTVDYPEDFLFVKKVYESLFLVKPDFDFNDIVCFLDQNPQINDINKMHPAKINDLFSV